MDESARIEALIALGATRDPALVPRVETILATNPPPRVVRMAAIALGNLGGPRAFDRLVSLLRHRNPTVRAGAIDGLAILGDPRAIELLRALLDDDAKPELYGAGAIEGPRTVGTEAARAIRKLTP
jgi:HEAT repeat protein